MGKTGASQTIAQKSKKVQKYIDNSRSQNVYLRGFFRYPGAGMGFETSGIYLVFNFGAKGGLFKTQIFFTISGQVFRPFQAPTTTTTMPVGVCVAVDVTGSMCSPNKLCGRYLRDGTVERRDGEWPVFYNTAPRLRSFQNKAYTVQPSNY